MRNFVYTGLLIVLLALVLLPISTVLSHDEDHQETKDEPAKEEAKEEIPDLPEDEAKVVGYIAPDFTLAGTDGESYSLSGYKGKVIIVNFWATWCPPCREEIPDLIKIQKEYGEKGLQIVSISVDRGKEEKVEDERAVPDDVKKLVGDFATKNGMTYPVLFYNKYVTKRYGGIKYIPTTFIVGRDGKVRTKIVGSRDKKEFEEIFLPLLKEKEPEAEK